ncbi:MAG: hypothetical protein ACREJ5_04120 [Geminicoccaceae bacterium]
MTISRTLYSGFAADGGAFDSGKFVEAVLLFDKVLISDPTILPKLINSVGVAGLLQLLAEGRVAVVGGGPSAQGTYDFKHPGFFSNRPLDRPLRFGFETIYADPHAPGNLSAEDRLARDLQKAKTSASIDEAQLKKVHTAILPTMQVIDGKSLRTSDDFRKDLASKHDSIVGLLLDSLVKDIKIPVYALNIQTSLEEVAAEIFQINTNLGRILGVGDDTLHEWFKKPFFEITGTHLQLHRMRAVEAASGLTESQAIITAKRLDFLSRIHTESDVRSELARIIDIAHVPSLPPNSKIDVDKLIWLRDSAEARSFREWLHHSRRLSDQEIEAMLSDWKNILGEALKSNYAKAVRLLVSTVAGSLAGDGGIAVGIIDSFLLNKLLPGMGPIGFVAGNYKKYLGKQQVK